jgi:hypothetical protein
VRIPVDPSNLPLYSKELEARPMAKALKPKSLSPRQYRVIMLHHQGLGRKQIASATGYGITRISEIINSEWGRAHLEQLMVEERAEAASGGAERWRALLEAEVLPSIKKLASLRDTATSERTQAYSAANLLDRTVPRKIQETPPPSQFVLPPKVAEQLLQVLKETQALDAAYDVTSQSLERQAEDD